MRVLSWTCVRYSAKSLVICCFHSFLATLHDRAHWSYGRTKTTPTILPVPYESKEDYLPKKCSDHQHADPNTKLTSTSNTLYDSFPHESLAEPL